VLDFKSNDTTFDTKVGMEKYRKADILRLRRFLNELKVPKPKQHHLVSLTRLTGLINKIGFIGPYKCSGSKRPFSHELLKDHPSYFDGRVRMAEAHGKKDMIFWADFEKYVLDAIEYVLDRIEAENLILEDDENV
jgi:hypothetical protein